MKNTLFYIKTLRKDLKYIFIMSLAYILLYNFLFVKVNSFFNGAHIFGDIFLKISFSLLATIIFYMINIHIPATNSKIKIFLFLSNKIHFLCNVQTSLIRSVEVNSERNFDKDLKHNEHQIFIIDNIDDFCSKLNPNKLTFKWSTKRIFNNWQELIAHHHYESNKVIFEILVFKDILFLISLCGYKDLYMFHLNHDAFNVLIY